MSAPRILILAGGSGTRFWPASRRLRPKHLLPLLSDGKTLLRSTTERVAVLGGEAQVYVVTAEDQRALVEQDLAAGTVAAAVLAEPAPRNTGPAIVWALASLEAAGGSLEDPVVVLPSDAWVDDPAAFRACLEEACEVARSSAAIVTLGVVPDRAATGYGYLEIEGPSDRLGEKRSPEALAGIDKPRVVSFCEKPSAAVAAGFVDGGRHLWNAGVFVFSPWTLRSVLASVAPDLDSLFIGLLDCFARSDMSSARALYAASEARSFDYAVMEQAPEVRCVRATFGWSDLGSWDALGPLLEQGEGGAFRAESLISERSSGNLVFAPGRSVGLLGVEDLIVVATEDAVLVAHKKDAQAVRELTQKLKDLGREDLL